MDAWVNGVKLFYQESGSPGSQALLLVHGFPLDSGMWEAQVEGLGGRAHVIAPDLRGHGRSDVSTSPASIEQYADDLVALLDHLHVGKAVVAGLSMGGYIAFAFWRRHPQRMAGLALIDTRAQADTDEGRAGRDATIERVQAHGAAVLVEEMLPRLLSPHNLPDERVAGCLREMIMRQPAQGVVHSLSAMRDREDSTATLSSISIPTVVIVGEHDEITPPDVAAEMTRDIPQARLVQIGNAGHMSPMENPSEVNIVLGELLSIARF